ncbi:MAG: inositol monophosphatase [Candidatus Kaiserbacteria bacterium]|nr:inositol monophosphatase [Candidatus Kaiserbacteria bacterium]
MSYEQEFSAAKEIAKKAGAIMLQYFDGEQQLERKSDDSPITVADTLVNRMVIEELTRLFPQDGIVGEEESTAEYGMGRRWICDPIDGTKSFVIGVPTAVFSLALAVDGKIVLGVVYDPFLDKMFEATRGSGSFCNGIALHVSNEGLTDGYIAVTSRVNKIVNGSEHLRALAAQGARLVTFSGSVYKMCLIARGRLAGYVEEQLNPHDIAAGQIIIEEAGGKVTGMDGGELDYSKPFCGAVFSNGLVHDELLPQ